MNAIEVENVSKRFKNLLVLRSVSFNVKKGECFALIGPNGAGKSTLIKILTTLIRPTTGNARVMGHDLRERKIVRKQLGLVSENTIFYDQLSAMENLVFFAGLYHIPKHVAKIRAEELLKLVGMWEWRNKLLKTFSTGMKQRINVIRALMHSPDIIFMDEPTLALDPQTSLIIKSTIRHVKDKGVTVFFTTHIMELVEDLANRIAIMNSGEIVANGTLEDLKSRFEDEEKKITLEFENGALASLGYETFKKMKTIKKVKKNIKSIEISSSSKGVVMEIMDEISRTRLPIKSVNTLKPSLEEIFVKLTGFKPQEKK